MRVLEVLQKLPLVKRGVGESGVDWLHLCQTGYFDSSKRFAGLGKVIGGLPHVFD